MPSDQEYRDMAEARTPETITAHAQDYSANAWKDYTLDELGAWVHLLAKRATHRFNPEKRKKDLYDARNYLAMMTAHLDALDAGTSPLDGSPHERESFR